MGKDVGPELLMSFIVRVMGVEDWHPHLMSGNGSVGEGSAGRSGGDVPVDSPPLESQEPLG